MWHWKKPWYDARDDIQCKVAINIRLCNVKSESEQLLLMFSSCLTFAMPAEAMLISSMHGLQIVLVILSFTTGFVSPFNAIVTSSDYTFSCTYDRTQPNATITLTWSFTPVGGNKVTVIQAQYMGTTGNTLAAPFPGYETRATFVGDLSTQDASFKLTGVTLTDTGEYECAVSSFPGGVSMSNAIITVLDPPGIPTLSLSPTPVCETENQDVQLTCSVTSGTTPFAYSFKHGDTQLASDGSASLTLSGVDRNQTGTYTCTVSNGLGEDYAQTSTGQTLVVHYLGTPQLTPSSKVTILEGNDLSVVCSATSNPASPTLQWSKGGTNEPAGATLRKNPVSRSYAGTYTCTATNTCGTQSITTSAELVVDVQYPPDGNPTCNATTSGDNMNVVLNCELQGGDPAVDLVWTDDSGQVGTSQVSVNQMNAPVTANGTTYTCTATSVALSPDRTCTVTLTTPSVSVSPQLLFAVLLGTASHSLPCTVDSPGVPAASALTWTGPAVTAGRTTGGTLATPSLTISGVEKADAGDHTCTATNLVGDGTDSIRLVVHYGPTGTVVTPATAKEKEGDPLTLNCTTDGVPSSNFTWSKNPGAVPDGTVDGSMVQISRLHRNDAGTYNCTADNGIGNSDSATSSVDVLYLDTPTLNQTSPLTVLESNDVSILCSAVANPTAGYKWTKQNSSEEWNSDVLSFPQINRSDAGIYICEASSVIKGTNETRNKTLEIIVKYPPELTVVATPNPVNETQSISLTCTADSNPDVTSMTWTFVDTGETLQQTTGNSLTYANNSVSHDNAGTYRCTADNGVMGSPVSEDLTINVNFVPIFNHTKNKYAIGSSQPVTLVCSAFAYPPQIIHTWMKGGYDITGNATSQGGVSTLSIASVQRENYGDYTCTASNGHGQQSIVIELVAETQPEPSTNLAYTKKTSLGVVTLTWAAEFNGGLETTHTVQYRMEETTDWVSGPSVVEAASQNRPEFTQAVKLSVQGRYEIRIQAQNSQGAVGSNIIQVLVEDNLILYGTIAITSVDYTAGVCDGELGNRIITQLDSIFDSFKGYEGAEITGCRSGSVLADFEATVAQSEAAAAQTTYTENLVDGRLGEFTADYKSSRISDTNVAAGGGISITIIIIIIIVAVVCGVVLIVIVVVVCFCRGCDHDKKGGNPKECSCSLWWCACCHRRCCCVCCYHSWCCCVCCKEKEDSQEIACTERPTSSNGLFNHVFNQSTENIRGVPSIGEGTAVRLVEMPSMNIYNEAQREQDDPTGAVAGTTAGPIDPNYATVNTNDQIPTGNPYDDVNFEQDKKAGAVAGATAGPLDPTAQYATVNKNIQIPTGDPYDEINFSGATPRPVGPTAQYDTVNKSKDNATPDPNTVYSQVNKDKKKKDKEKPTLMVDPSAEYATVNKSKKKKKDMPPPPEDPSAQYSEVKKSKKKDKKASPPPEVIYTEVKKDKKEKKDKKKPSPAKKPAAKNEERLYDDVPGEKKKNPQGLIYAELSTFQVKSPPKKPTKSVPPKPRYEDAPTEYASINWNAARRRTQERSQSEGTTDDEAQVTI